MMEEASAPFVGTSLAGRILIAPPEPDVSDFTSALTLVLEHGTEGALGVFLNRNRLRSTRSGNRRACTRCSSCWPWRTADPSRRPGNLRSSNFCRLRHLGRWTTWGWASQPRLVGCRCHHRWFVYQWSEYSLGSCAQAAGRWPSLVRSLSRWSEPELAIQLGALA